ncbi:MAG: hypothetical protein RJA70_3962 [Pseudomonadota bacterium]|jgi:chromosome partitioning protein
MKIAVMEGKLDDVDLPGVLQVVGLGRQFTGVELREKDSVVGTIFVKAGRIVGAESGELRGKAAFFDLFQRPSTFFHVYRSAVNAGALDSIGSLSSLLVEALGRARDESNVEVVAAPQPELTTSPGLAPPPPATSGGSTRSRAGVPAKKAASVEPGLVSPLDLDTGGKSGVVLSIASPKGGCGKTTVALNLAISLARQRHRVILVDADINGDVLSWLNARHKPHYGTYDVLVGLAEVESCLLGTILPELQILPALGKRIPSASEVMSDQSDAWKELASKLAQMADVVLIDCPSGMYGGTHQVLKASTHVLGVLQAEAVARRSFDMFREGLKALPEGANPAVAGVLLNMLQARHGASLAVLQDACASLPENWLLETSIPRSAAFLDASGEGLPVRMMDDNSPPAVSWLFDTLAAEVTQRVGLNAPSRSRPRSLLL